MQRVKLGSASGMVAMVSGFVASWVLLAEPATSAVPDIEPNDSIATAQNLDGFFDLRSNAQVEDGALVNTSTTIPHAEVNSLGDLSGTVDYYSFTVPAGARIIVDIDCGENGGGPDTGCGAYSPWMDSWIELYDPSGAFFAFNDDSAADTGSDSSYLDSFLEIAAPVGGVWTVAVGEYPSLQPITPGAEYILHVSVNPVVQGPIVNPANNHTYYRLANSNWTTAEAFAVSLGGHLVSINDAAENAFVLSTFANAAGSGRVWLGLNDAASEGDFVFTNGDPFVYSNWDPGEPNDSGLGEDYVAMYSGNGRWVDVADLANPPGIGQIYGVVEVPVLTITFDNVPSTVMCNEVWQEHHLEMWFTETTAEDDGDVGRCDFDATHPGEISLYPSRFMVDMGNSVLVNRVEVDVMSNCGDCTRAFLYHDGATVDSAMAVGGWEEETLLLTPVGGNIDAIAVSSMEGLVTEIRFVSVPEPSRWLLLAAGLGCLGVLWRVRVR